MPNVLGTMQANEVLKIILELVKFDGELLLYNSLDNCFQTIEIHKNTDFKNKIKIEYKSISETEF